MKKGILISTLWLVGCSSMPPSDDCIIVMENNHGRMDCMNEAEVRHAPPPVADDLAIMMGSGVIV